MRGSEIETSNRSELFWINSSTGLLLLGEVYIAGPAGGFVVNETGEGVCLLSVDCSQFLSVLKIPRQT